MDEQKSSCPDCGKEGKEMFVVIKPGQDPSEGEPINDWIARTRNKKTKYHKKGLVEWMLFIESEEQSEKLRANILMWFPWLEKAIDALSKHIDKHPKLYKKAK